mmetsp:Transcript_13090/g.50017  ORF Transcript_13090/g.50017 Transcript_13090/m.50017 type:complete len:204 (+) Transcript_13090:452-1063(+)
MDPSLAQGVSGAQGGGRAAPAGRHGGYAGRRSREDRRGGRPARRQARAGRHGGARGAPDAEQRHGSGPHPALREAARGGRPGRAGRRRDGQSGGLGRGVRQRRGPRGGQGCGGGPSQHRDARRRGGRQRLLLWHAGLAGQRRSCLHERAVGGGWLRSRPPAHHRGAWLQLLPRLHGRRGGRRSARAGGAPSGVGRQDHRGRQD